MSARHAHKHRSFPDVMRMRTSFSAVLVLQRGAKLGSAESAVYDSHWEKLRASTDCPVTGEVTTMNIAFPRFLKEQPHAPQGNVSLNSGDMYIFNSNRVHEVFANDGEKPRVIISNFFGMSDDEILLYA